MPIINFVDERLEIVHYNIVGLLCIAFLVVSFRPYSLLLHVDGQGGVIDETVTIVSCLILRY